MFRLEQIDVRGSSWSEAQEVHLTGSVGLAGSPTPTRLSFQLTEGETAALVRLVSQAAQRAVLSMLPPMSPDLAYAVATAVASAIKRTERADDLSTEPA